MILGIYLMLKENCIAEKLFELKSIKRKCCYHKLTTHT